jgi:hypothetical protein
LFCGRVIILIKNCAMDIESEITIDVPTFLKDDVDDDITSDERVFQNNAGTLQKRFVI